MDEAETRGLVVAGSVPSEQAQYLVVRPDAGAELLMALDGRDVAQRFVGLEVTRVVAGALANGHSEPYQPEGYHAGGPARATLSALHADPVILVRPLSPLTSVSSNLEGPVSLRPVGEELIERMRHVPPREERTPGVVPEEFEFVARDTAKLMANAGGRLSISGDFAVYLWGATYDIAGTGSGSVRTGMYEAENHADSVIVERYVHAFLTVHDGTLDIQYNRGETALYAPRGQATTTESLQLRNAVGAVDAEAGRYHVDGDVTIRAGRVEWQPGGQTLSLSLAGVQGVSGAVVSLTPHWISGPLLPSLVGVAGLAFALVFLWVRPLLALRTSDAAVGDLTLAERRALGWSHLARQASNRNRHRLASWYSQRAIRSDPVEGGHYLARALTAANLGRYEQALEFHKVAHWILQAQPGAVEDVGRNAFEASCVASNLHRSREALHWLRIALHHDPGLREEAAFEPDLGPISQDPAFQCLVGGVVDVQWRAA